MGGLNGPLFLLKNFLKKKPMILSIFDLCLQANLELASLEVMLNEITGDLNDPTSEMTSELLQLKLNNILDHINNDANSKWLKVLYEIPNNLVDGSFEISQGCYIPYESISTSHSSNADFYVSVKRVLRSITIFTDIRSANIKNEVHKLNTDIFGYRKEITV